MGCAMNKPLRGAHRHRDNSPQVFKVFNVDDHGHERNPGKIEINEHDLILFQKGKDAIHWPLRSLRRYGFDAELFSFESGRRCPTGPGIYAFKCRRAEALFNLLQEFIVRAGQSEDSGNTGGTTRPPSDSSPRPGSLVELAAPPLDTHTTSPHHEYMNNGVVARGGAHEYVNTALPPLGSHTLSGGVQYDQVVDSGAVTLTVHRHNSHSAHAFRKPSSEEHVIQYAELDLPQGGGGSANGDDSAGGGEEGASGPLPNGRVAPGGALHPVGASAQPTRGLPQDEEDEESSQAMYINVPAKEIKRPGVAGYKVHASSSPTTSGPPRLKHLQRNTNTSQISSLPPPAAPSGDDPHNYANLGLLAARSGQPRVVPNNNNGAPPKLVPKSTAEPGMPPKLTYIQLDHDTLNSNSAATGVVASSNSQQPNNSPTGLKTQQHSAPGSPSSRKTDSYALIDFDRTQALHARNAVSEEEGARKTRHNSNIDELN